MAWKVRIKASFYKVYCVVKKMVWNVRIKAFLYTNDIKC